MNNLYRSFAILATALGLVATGTFSIATAAPQYAEDRHFDDRHDGRYSDVEGLVGRTQNDLASAIQFASNGKERERYRNAQHHLSTFDRHLTKGSWDKDNLNESIGDIQSVLDHNTLHAEDRERLLRDVSDLRMVRQRR
jgi:hypothetical protein